jgi:hypothetical protein
MESIADAELKKRLGNLDDPIFLALNRLALFRRSKLHIDFDIGAISIYVPALLNGRPNRLPS